MKYYHRLLEKPIKQALKTFPALVLTGPRQSGKTTLLAKISQKTHQYISLEDPDTRLQVNSDPRGFLTLNHRPLFLDEIQYCPEILPYIKTKIDSNRENGYWILSGSQHFPLMTRVSESLAGRAAVMTLLPFSWSEFYKEEITEPLPTAERILRGFYPTVLVQPGISFQLWYSSYIQTYLERDVRAVVQVENLSMFEKFLRLLAGRTGQLLNLSELGREVGITHTTAQRWLSVLETNGQIFLLPPYYKNYGKRLIKSPKIYFLDTGLACHLFGLRYPEHLIQSPYWGNIFETLVMAEWVKLFRNNGMLPPLYFWRSSDGYEADCLVEMDGRLHAFEIKATQTPLPAHGRNLKKFRELMGKEALPGKIMCFCQDRHPCGQDITAEPWLVSIRQWSKTYLKP